MPRIMTMDPNLYQSALWANTCISSLHTDNSKLQNLKNKSWNFPGVKEQTAKLGGINGKSKIQNKLRKWLGNERDRCAQPDLCMDVLSLLLPPRALNGALGFSRKPPTSAGVPVVL